MGDGNTCKILGIGDTRISMFDGITRLFSYVRHVPELQKSLRSLGKLDHDGYKFSREKSQLRMSTGDCKGRAT